MNLTVDSFDKICRSCLSASTNLKSLFSKVDGSDRNLVDVLTYTTNVNIRTDDLLPKLVCNECEIIMCKADAFKRRCHDSELILINITIGNDNDFSQPQIDKKCLIKNENNDTNYKNLLNEPLNSSNIDLQDNYDVKEVILKELDECIQSDKPNSSRVENDLKLSIVKEELGDDFDDDHSSPHDDEKLPKVIAIEYKPEKDEVHTCYCKTIFNNKNKYELHLKRYHCDKYKNVLKKLGKNVIRIKNEITCQQCDRHFSTVAGWKAHQRSHEGKKTLQKSFKCTKCSRKFKHNRTLLTHLQKHNNEPVMYECDKCKRQFKYKAYLENHIISLHSSNGLTCDICMQTFTDKDTFTAHRDSHRIDRCYQCGICKKSFYVSSTLKEHLRTHTGEKPFLCSVCGRGFSQRNNMLQHMRRHQGVKPYKCENCEKKFVSKGELEAHMRKHSGAHPFVCDECGNGFTTSSSLVKHRRTHTGERPYACDLCPMRFAAGGTLKNHRRTHTGERPYQCSYCEKAFVQKNDLKSHIRCHTGERPYVCTHCGQRFRKPAGLKAHARLHPHQSENQPTLTHAHQEEIILSTHCESIK